jgi:hypothetical protein
MFVMSKLASFKIVQMCEDLNIYEKQIINLQSVMLEMVSWLFCPYTPTVRRFHTHSATQLGVSVHSA